METGWFAGPQVTCFSPIQYWGYRYTPPHMTFYVGAGGLNSGLYACKVNTLPIANNFSNLEYTFWQSKNCFRWARWRSKQKFPNTTCDARACGCLLSEISGIPRSSSVGSAESFPFLTPFSGFTSLYREDEYDIGTQLLFHVLFI